MFLLCMQKNVIDLFIFCCLTVGLLITIDLSEFEITAISFHCIVRVRDDDDIVIKEGEGFLDSQNIRLRTKALNWDVETDGRCPRGFLAGRE